VGCGAQRRGSAARGKNRRQDGLLGLIRRGGGGADRLSDIGGSNGNRRNEQHDHGVDAGVGEHLRQRDAEAVGGRRAQHVDRVRRRCLRREPGSESDARLLIQLGELETSDLARVGAEDAETARVREHGDAAPARNGLG